MSRGYTLPDLCRSSAILVAVLVAELVVIVLALVRTGGNFFVDLGLMSVYAQWVCLGSLALLCACRERIARLPRVVGILFTLGLCLLVFVLVETLSQWALMWQWGVSWDWSRFARHLVADLLVSALVLRFFAVVQLLNERGRSELQSRVQALHSRIQPHFLFNSLNTIAELTVAEPKQAEQAIQSLADLFRAALSDAQTWHSVRDELALCQGYLELERWRLGDRLRMKWHVELADSNRYQVPRLIVQPLIENAVVHGIQPTVEGGHIWVTVAENKDKLMFRVSNSLPARQPESRGSGLALRNTGERLAALYDEGYRLKVDHQEFEYAVTLWLPKAHADVFAKR